MGTVTVEPLEQRVFKWPVEMVPRGRIELPPLRFSGRLRSLK
jgi:hypothetical protein